MRAGNRCSICGRENKQLHAHEVWYFDYASKMQTLKDIIALCPACHGVKHFRNSERIGYGEQAKKHFMQINKCSELEFAAYCMQVKVTYDKLNEVLRWKIIADLTPFGGGDMKRKENTILLLEIRIKIYNFHSITEKHGKEFVVSKRIIIGEKLP